MKGNKFLAAVLAASMAFSTVPVTALNVFAENVAVEASNNLAAKAAKSCTVNGQNIDDVAKNSEAYLIYYAIKECAFTDTGTATVQEALNTLSDSTAHQRTVNSVKSDVNTSATVEIKDYDSTIYTYVFSTSEVKDMDGAETDALDQIFDNLTVISYDKNPITVSTVQTAFNTAFATARGTTGSYYHTGEDGDAIAGYTVVDATVAGGKVTGKIVRTSSDGKNTYYYSYSATAVENTDSQSNMIDAAINAVEETAYPSPSQAAISNDAATGDVSTLVKKVQKDINDKLDGKATVTLDATDVTFEPATHKTTGLLTVKTDTGKTVAIRLSHSSGQKMAEADKQITKTALKTATEKEAETTTYSIKDEDGNELNKYHDDSDNTKDVPANVWDFASTTKFAHSIQSSSATTAVDAETVRAAVEKAVADSVKDYTNDNVTYKVESQKGKIDLDGPNGSGAAIDTQTKATSSAGGTYVVKVTASIANDFYGYDDSQEATDSKTYYVVVRTPKLKTVTATDFKLADETYIMKDGAYTLGSNKADVVTITPALTPADANEEITWTVAKADGTTMSATPEASVAGSVTAKGSTTAETITNKDGKVIVTKAGKYKVTAETKSGKKASMILTVKDNFKDVPATAYYAESVKKAYADGVTAGISNDTFGAGKTVTRAQYVTWLYKYAVAQDSSVEIADADVKASFSDVSASAYYAKAVQWAVENGVTAGTSSTTFSPNKTITRAEAVTMLWIAKGRPLAGEGQEDEKTLKFTDVPSTAYYKSAVIWAVKSSTTYGTSATTFGPNDSCTRAQAIAFIY